MFTILLHIYLFVHTFTNLTEWEVDYIKLDECYGGANRTDGSCHDLDPSVPHRLSIMRDALNSTGRRSFVKTTIK